MTTTTPFIIRYLHQGLEQDAEVHPCCKEDDIVDYAVYHNGKLSFTTRRAPGEKKWIIAMKNADDEISQELLQNVGAQIDQHTNN